MSIVVAVRKNGRVAIAADTAQSDDSLVIGAGYIVNHSKILQVGDSYMGLTGWTVSQQIMESAVRNHPDIFDLSDRAAVFESMRRLHAVLKEEYFLSTVEDKEQPVESSQLCAMVAGPHGVFEIESYRTVTECTCFWALGSGKPLALGAMHAVYARSEDCEAIARAGVEAACEFDEGCALPLEVRSVRLASN